MKVNNQKDRIKLVNLPGEQKFFYIPYDSKEELDLFPNESIAFSGSIFGFFRDLGCMNGKGAYSITIKQLYEYKKQIHANYKSTKLFENRLPAAIKTALGEHGKQPEKPKYSSMVNNKQLIKANEDYERVA